LFIDISADGNTSLRTSQTGFVSDTPSKVRPTNPTPGHASGGGTPTKVRPDNPTPLAAEAHQRGARPSKFSKCMKRLIQKADCFRDKKKKVNYCIHIQLE